MSTLTTASLSRSLRHRLTPSTFLKMLRCEDELTLFVTFAFVLAAAGYAIATDTEKTVADPMEASKPAAVVCLIQLWLCQLMLCQAPLIPPLRRARRRSWTRLRTTYGNIRSQHVTATLPLERKATITGSDASSYALARLMLRTTRLHA